MAWSTSEHGQPQRATPGNIPCIVEQLLLDRKGGLLAEIEKNIAMAVPEDYDGPVCLDIERTPPGPAWVSLIGACRGVRPSARYGFYGVPRNQYWQLFAPQAHPLAWPDEIAASARRWVLDRADVIFGNVYAHYPIAGEHTAARFRLFVELNTIAALAAARNRPVYMMALPWYHPASPLATWPTRLSMYQLGQTAATVRAMGADPLWWAVTSPKGDKPDTVTPQELQAMRTIIDGPPASSTGPAQAPAVAS